MFILPFWRGVLPRFPQLYGCFRKRRYPQIININRVFHYKPSILGETPPIFGNTHITVLPNMMSPSLQQFSTHFQKSSWSVNNCQPKPPHQKALQVRFRHGQHFLKKSDHLQGETPLLKNPPIFCIHSFFPISRISRECHFVATLSHLVHIPFWKLIAPLQKKKTAKTAAT